MTVIDDKKGESYEGSIATVQNNRVDRSTLIGLQVESSSLQNEMILKQSHLDEHLIRIKEIEAELATQQQALIARSRNLLHDAEVRLNLAKYSAENRKTDSERKLRLVAKGIFPGTKDELLNKIKLEDAKIEAAEVKVSMSNDDLEFATLGIYVGDNNQYLQNLQNDIRARKADVSQLNMQLSSLQTRLSELNSLTRAESKRVGMTAQADVSITRSEKIYKTVAKVGKQVNAGDTLAQAVDCGEAFVVAIFSERQAQSLSVGAKVIIQSDVWSSSVPGVVSRLMPRTTDRVDLDFAVPFPPTERRELYAFIVPEKYSPEFCLIGTWVSVTRRSDWVDKTRGYVNRAIAAVASQLDNLEMAFLREGTKLAEVRSFFMVEANAAGLGPGEKERDRQSKKISACIASKCQAADFLFQNMPGHQSTSLLRDRRVANIRTQAVFDSRWN